MQHLNAFMSLVLLGLDRLVYFEDDAVSKELFFGVPGCPQVELLTGFKLQERIE